MGREYLKYDQSESPETGRKQFYDSRESTFRQMQNDLLSMAAETIKIKDVLERRRAESGLRELAKEVIKAYKALPQSRKNNNHLHSEVTHFSRL